MSVRRAKPLAWSLFALTAVLLFVMAILSAGREPFFDTLLYGLLSISLATVGALVASRHPRNPIGWMFSGLALYGAFAESAEGWGYFAAEKGLPAGVVGEWIILWSWIGDLTMWTIILLLFPDGRLPSRRWRPVLWIAAAGFALALPGQALSPDRGSEFAAGTNPFAVEGGPLNLLFGTGMVLLLAALLAAIASLVVRFRRARNVERQQLKWFAYAAGCIGALGPLAVAFWYESVLVQVAFALAINGLPIAAGIAILRYRLYDIDVVLNRTLVYGTLTATLALVYLSCVVSLQYAFRVLTGQETQLAVVASTLAIAALFGPVRRRVQTFVDRRFYRKKYDARKTLDTFSARLRDKTDLDQLGGELVSVVRTTVQPSHASLWLREPSVDRMERGSA
ncbi:MAG: hypothetical protein ACRDTR_13520 [Rubrobacter sp.]